MSKLMSTKAAYISRESLPAQFQSREGKEAVNLYLCSLSSNNNIVTFDEQSAAEKYKEIISKFETIDALLDDIFKRLDMKESPSKTAIWYLNLAVDEIAKLCSKQISTRAYLQLALPTITEQRICRADGSEPSLAIVHYLNHVSPQFAGYFFENVIAYIIDIKNDENWYVEHYELPLSDDDKRLFEYLSSGSSLVSQLLLQSIKQWVRKRITLESYEPIFKFCESLKDDTIRVQVENYIKEIADCEPFKNWRTLPSDLKKHSIDVAGYIFDKYFHGEIDLLIAGRIVDVKVCKDIKLTSWFAQTSIYKQLASFPVAHLQIVSLMNNKIYKADV